MDDHDRLRAASAAELGIANRDHLLAGADRLDTAITRGHHAPTVPRPRLTPGVANNPTLAAWNSFAENDPHRNLDAEAQGDLHGGQLHRMNREARGERLLSRSQGPKAMPHQRPSFVHNPIDSNPTRRQRDLPLDPVLDNPNASALEIARALQSSRNYKAKGNQPNNKNYRPSGPSSNTRSGYGSGGGRRGSQQGHSLNPHADIHTGTRGNAQPLRSSGNQDSRASATTHSTTPISRGSAPSVAPVDLASHDTFMAAVSEAYKTTGVKKTGLSDSKWAPKEEDENEGSGGSA